MTSHDPRDRPTVAIAEQHVTAGGHGVNIHIGGAARPRLHPHASNLREPRGPFVGRDRELARLAAALAGKPAHAVIVCGPPGVGKSELAQRFALARRDDYPGGVFVVRLDSIAPPVDLATLGRAHLGLDFGPGDSLEAQW